ncbi:MAG: exo-alpha-sialidase, partial [Chlamydiia bacterium]|nr:exo-alpha-sialidase [Chlamydiia bacterium]
QPTLFHADKNMIKMLTRSKHIGYICTASSTDNGKTWTQASPINLPNPNSGIDAIRLEDGRILLVYNHSQSNRTPLNIALSYNGGESWGMALTLEDEGGSYSYPAVIQTEDSLVHITYSWNGTKIKHVSIDPLLLK